MKQEFFPGKNWAWISTNCLIFRVAQQECWKWDLHLSFSFSKICHFPQKYFNASYICLTYFSSFFNSRGLLFGDAPRDFRRWRQVPVPGEHGSSRTAWHPVTLRDRHRPGSSRAAEDYTRGLSPDDGGPRDRAGVHIRVRQAGSWSK